MKSIAIRNAILCVCAWAFIPVVSRFGQTDLNNHQFLFWSSLFSFLALLLVSWKSGRLNELKTYRARDWISASALGLLGAYLYFLLLYQGYAEGKGMEVLVIQYTWPIMIAALAPVILKETLGIRNVVAIVLGFAAVFTVLTRGHYTEFSVARPDLMGWVGLGAFCFALFCVFSKKIHLEPLSLTMVYFGVATIASFISMMATDGFAMPTTPQSWFIVIATGFFVNGLSDALWFWTLRQAPASFLAPFTFMTPIVSTGYMLIFFNEPFEWAYAGALILIVAAGLVNTLDLAVLRQRIKRRDQVLPTATDALEPTIASSDN
ncbi:Uncharacterised protein [BD1-7 clade bacterium]|uniref:EamA domain-containing protein n=1 Tax=BD1-7 clade bacterium TaxID=2029982 RepID=A0A5S9QML2_9GAMM|nr:Uncharacterised protein [BD1-7 clade bacterium]